LNEVRKGCYKKVATNSEKTRTKRQNGQLQKPVPPFFFKKDFNFVLQIVLRLWCIFGALEPTFTTCLYRQVFSESALLQ